MMRSKSPASETFVNKAKVAMYAERDSFQENLKAASAQVEIIEPIPVLCQSSAGSSARSSVRICSEQA